MGFHQFSINLRVTRHGVLHLTDNVQFISDMHVVFDTIESETVSIGLE